MVRGRLFIKKNFVEEEKSEELDKFNEVNIIKWHI